MSRVFFISDLHFGHKNLIINHRNMEIEAHDNLIIKNWNNTVTKRDIVYLVGDIVMEKPLLLNNYLPKLNGMIRVIGGNHDSPATSNMLYGLNIPIMGCLNYKGFMVTHIPIHPLEVNLFRGNIHGHVHETNTDYGGKYLNVTCERVNYTPIEFSKLLEKYNYKI